MFSLLHCLFHSLLCIYCIRSLLFETITIELPTVNISAAKVSGLSILHINMCLKVSFLRHRPFPCVRCIRTLCFPCEFSIFSLVLDEFRWVNIMLHLPRDFRTFRDLFVTFRKTKVKLMPPCREINWVYKHCAYSRAVITII